MTASAAAAAPRTPAVEAPAPTGAAASDVADAPSEAQGAAVLVERVEGERYQLVTASIRRLPLALLLMDLFCAWLVWRSGWPRMAGLWFAVAFGLHLTRWSLVLRWGRMTAPPAGAANRVMARLFTLLGSWMGVMVALVFTPTLATEHYLATVVCVGVAAGAGVASGWSARVFAGWSIPVGGALILGWLLRGGSAGIGIAVLLLALFLVLFAQTRDQQLTLLRLVRLAWHNEQLAASLRAERDRAEAASQSRTRFFAAASHDLRQPLHALSINAYALSMLARRQGNAKVLQLSDSIDRALRQSTGLLDGLLDVSRLDAGAVQPELRDFDVAALLEGVRQEFAPLAAQSGLTLTIDAPRGARAIVRTDPDLLRRVLHNLIGNALKFTHEGGVRLVADARAAQVCVSVIDTGSGIAPAEQERVFEEFYQIGNPSRDRSHGLGLGLAIVRRIAALLDLDVRLVSAPGQGTRVDLSIPAGAAAGLSGSADSAAVARPESPRLGLAVLVIDDEREIRESMTGLLEQLGCDVRCAAGRDEALVEVRGGFTPDVIVADHRLRGHTGQQAIAAVAAIIGARPAVVITGDTAPQTLQQLLASGQRVLHKPVDGATLERVLRELGSARSQRPPT